MPAIQLARSSEATLPSCWLVRKDTQRTSILGLGIICEALSYAASGYSGHLLEGELPHEAAAETKTSITCRQLPRQGWTETSKKASASILPTAASQ